MPTPPLRAAIIPVTPLQQNCTLLWCTATMRGALVDPGGDAPRLRAAVKQHRVTIEKVLLTHGHFDHAAEAKPIADEWGVPIEGPEEQDRYWLARLDDDGRQFGLHGVPFEPDRWLADGDMVSVGDLSFDVYHTPGHTLGHVIFHHPGQKLAITGDVLFQGSIGRTDFAGGDQDQLIESIRTKLWPLGSETVFLPGHGPASTFAHERATNPYVADRVLGTA